MYQPGRFGDILYTIPIARRLKEKGYDTYFMINEKYESLIPHFPDINFVDCDNNKNKVPKEPCIFLPLWYGKNIDPKYSPEDLMINKYKMYNEAFNDNIDPMEYWRTLTFKRFPEKEEKLRKLLGINGEKYVLINEKYSMGEREIKVDTDLKNVYMGYEPDEFSLLDWSSIIEGAEEIHTVHTSIIYLIELLETTKKIHLYKRLIEDVPITHIMKKGWIEK